MGIIDSLSQLIRTTDKKNLGQEIIINKEKKEEEEIKEYVERNIKNTIHRLRNTYLEIWDNNLEILVSWNIPGEYDEDSEDINSYLEKLADLFKKYYIVPTNPKGGSLNIIGKPDLYFGEPITSDEKEKYEKKLKKIEKKIGKLVKKGILKGGKDEILKRFEKICKDYRKKKKILILIKPDENKIKEEIKKILEERKTEKIRCMLCSSIGYPAREEEISNTLQWLVTKNVTFIYNFSLNNYCGNVPICDKCIRVLSNKYIDLRDSFKFLRYNFKVFPEKISDENVESLWSFFSNKGDGFDTVITLLPQKILQNINPNSVFLNVLIYEKKSNKVDIVDMVENIRLVDVMNLYKIFNEWKSKKKINIKLIDGKNSIFRALIPDKGEGNVKTDESKENKEKYFLEFILCILNKLLRKERIDKKTQDKIMIIFNKLSRKYLYQDKKEKIKEIIILIDFLNYYNQNLET